jgi:hypothetical protein
MLQYGRNKAPFTFSVYRKPTTTDSTIPLDSCHSQEHEHVAIHHLINRKTTYALNAADKEERNIIKHIVSSNKYDTSMINRREKPKNNSKQQSGTKWANFIYIGKENKFITKIFKYFPINITFTTRHTIKKLINKTIINS